MTTAINIFQSLIFFFMHEPLNSDGAELRT